MTKVYVSGEDTVLEQLLKDYRNAKVDLQPALTELKNMEKHIKQLVMDTGEVAEIDGVSVSIRNGYTRSSWNTKGLEALASLHPWILRQRTEREIGPSVVIKVKL